LKNCDIIIEIANAIKQYKYKDYIGCSRAELINHLVKQFKPGMTLKNHGKWHIDHIKPCAAFNKNNPKWELLGSFDYSKLNLGFCPKSQPDTQSKKTQYRIVKDNIEYFEKMCQSNFVLCPAGDAPWSFRFYEVLMCKSIPIVESWHHTYRTKEEAKINYKYILYQYIENVKNDINYDDYVNENTKIFENSCSNKFVNNL
jgi:hypothetical protein